MEFDAWEPFYHEILKDFGFSREKDEAVAVELDKLLGGNRVPDSSLRKLMRGKEVTVAGNGPNVAQEIGGARGVLLTADEATSVALEKGLLPAILVTDLDGTVSDQVKANVEGAIAVIHGHGDNTIQALWRSPEFRRLHGRRSGGLPRGSLRRRPHPLGRFRFRTSECERPRPRHEAAEARLGVHPPRQPASRRAQTMRWSSGTSASAN